jgi:hypothetical protein
MAHNPTSTIWRFSAYERARHGAGVADLAAGESKSVLVTTLLAELRQLQSRHRAGDVVEVLAACLRQRESALLLLRHRDRLWPVTVFPARGVYHVKKPILPALEAGSVDLEIVGVEPATVRPPNGFVVPEGEDPNCFHPIGPLLWTVAVVSPHPFLLAEIRGRAAYRLAPDFMPEPSTALGALGPAMRRLRHEISPLREIARWPGMDMERAMRLLNGVYLQGGLMVLRTHPSARDDVAGNGRWIDWLRRWRLPGAA